MHQVLWILLLMLSGWLVARAAYWLPTHYTREEAAWLKAVKAHAPSDTMGFCYEPPSVIQLMRSFLSGFPPLNALTFVGVIGVCAVFAWVLLTQIPIASQVSWFMFGSVLVLLGLVDFQTKLLPDILTLPLMWLGMVIQLWPETRTVGLELAVIGAVAGYLPLWLFAHLYKLIRGRDGLGMGDLKLLAAMGAWSGPFILPQVLLIAALLAIALFVFERVLCRSTVGIHEERPFGPAIVAAYFIVMVFAY